jgi:hypothetical protein
MLWLQVLQFSYKLSPHSYSTTFSLKNSVLNFVTSRPVVKKVHRCRAVFTLSTCQNKVIPSDRGKLKLVQS